MILNARYLWRAIARRLTATQDVFSWRQVREGDLDVMLDLMREAGMTPGSLYAGESAINRWMGVLYRAHVTVLPRRKTRTPPPQAPGTIQEDGTVRRNHKLPDRVAVEALAEVRCRDDLSDADRLWPSSVCSAF
jgi:hypothetical protein